MTTTQRGVIIRLQIKIQYQLPLKIYLFGSFAKDTYTEESDFDFYIIVNDEIKNLKDLTTQAYRSIRKIKKRPVDIIVETESTFENKKSGIYPG